MSALEEEEEDEIIVSQQEKNNIVLLAVGHRWMLASLMKSLLGALTTSTVSDDLLLDLC